MTITYQRSIDAKIWSTAIMDRQERDSIGLFRCYLAQFLLQLELKLENRARNKRILNVFKSKFRLSYVEASRWCSATRMMAMITGDALCLDVVDVELSSSLKAGSRVDPVSLNGPWCTWFSLWSPIKSPASSSDRRSPVFLECLGNSMSITW